MIDPKKVANNMLDFLIDPTKIPVRDRLYFRPGENLQNGTYEGAKAHARDLYKDQRFNADFYPSKKSLIKEAGIMDRKTMIASLDILSKNFKKGDDPIATQLRTMAFAMSKMSDEDLAKRLALHEETPEQEAQEEHEKSETPAEEAAEEKKEKGVEAAKTFPCPKCGTKVLEQTKYCVKCKSKVKPGKKASEITDDFWSVEASDVIARAMVSDVLGVDVMEPEEKEPEEPKSKEADQNSPHPQLESPAAVPAMAPAPEEKPAEKPAPKDEEEEEVEAKKVVPEEKKPEEKPAEPAAAPAAIPVPDGKMSTVNTEILGSSFGDIEMNAGLITADDIGEMSPEEKTRLSQLFN
jgi:hypothetical protein